MGKDWHKTIMEDYIVRATAAGGQMRAFAATTKNLVESARVHHNTSPVATAALGRNTDSRGNHGKYDEK